MSINCNFTNDSDCSSLFEQVEVPFTAVQATAAIFITLTSVPINVLLIAAMVIYRRELDMSGLISVSVLVSNIIVSVFFTGSTAITSIARSWLFGFLGCKISSFISSFGLTSRWATIGFISFDRFGRVFWPFFYERHEKKIVVSLLISSWSIALVVPTVMWLCNAFVFTVAVPGCLFTYISDMPVLQTAISNIVLAVNPILGLIVPIILYTVMYCKARKLNKRSRIVPVMPENSDLESARRNRPKNKATITYVLMLSAFAAVNAFVIANLGVRAMLRKVDASISGQIVAGMAFSVLIRSYVLADIVIILKNKQQREVIKKFLKKLFKYKK